MCIIWKLSKDGKADWAKHLPELVHAYNSMRLPITRYNPHYLMFRCQPCLPIDFYFPMVWGTQKYQSDDHYIMKDCKRPLKRLRCSPHQRQRDRRGTTIAMLMPFYCNQMTWSWLKLMPTERGER